VITLEDWAVIRRLFVSEKLPKAEIARQLGISRNTVAKAVASADPPAYSRSPVVTSFAPLEAQIRALLSMTPSMPATVLAERVGWTGAPSWFRQNVAAIRADYAPADPADRIVYHLAGMWSLLATQLGAVPRKLIWDNETGIGRRNRLAAGVGEFCGALATKINQLKAYDPESKGGVERMNGYFETSFLPGRVFESTTREQPASAASMTRSAGCRWGRLICRRRTSISLRSTSNSTSLLAAPRPRRMINTSRRPNMA